ncbi:hypothetical protein Ciccas_009047 [Cichlidogyrus casuarinus]|uniref:Uncharacterized protein n=1 Tax=Cichlidogyrus casuarinus TaxID=1844966 RepID=A0ABD2PY72_9PLAT
MTRGSYSHGLLVPVSVYGSYAYPSRNERAAPDHLKLPPEVFEQEDAYVQDLAKAFMSKHRQLLLKVSPPSDCYPRHLWTDPTKLSACFFSQASRIVFLVTKETVHVFNAFFNRRIVPLLTRPLEKHGRPTWNSRILIVTLGELPICNDAWQLLPEDNIIQFFHTSWLRDWQSFDALRLVLENLWVSVEPQAIINSIHEESRTSRRETSHRRDFLTESDRQLGRQEHEPPVPARRLQLAKNASMREDSQTNTKVGTNTRVSGSIYRNSGRWDGSDSSPEKTGTLDRTFTADSDPSAHTDVQDESKVSSITIPVKQSTMSARDWEQGTLRSSNVTETMRSFVREEVNEKITYDKGKDSVLGTMPPIVTSTRTGWQSDNAQTTPREPKEPREPSPNTIEMLRKDLRDRSMFRTFLRDETALKSDFTRSAMSASPTRRTIYKHDLVDQSAVGKHVNSYTQMVPVPEQLGRLGKVLGQKPKVKAIEHLVGRDGDPYQPRRFTKLLSRLKCVIFKEKGTDSGQEAEQTRLKEIEQIMMEAFKKNNKSPSESEDEDDDPPIEVFRARILEAKAPVIRVEGKSTLHNFADHSIQKQ